jgi:hypothetical protein
VAASADERHCHAVAGTPFANALTYRLHDAGQLVPGHVRQHDIRIVSLPAVPVTQADAGGHDLENDTALRQHRIGDLLNFGRR